MRDRELPAGVVLRSSWQRRVVNALAPLVGVVIVQASVVGNDRAGWNLPDALLAAVLWAALVWFCLSMQSRNRLELRPGELYVRSGWRTSTVAASDIQGVAVERLLGTRLVTVWLRNGEKRRLPTAGRTEGLTTQRFDRDLRLIMDWWMANRTFDPVQERPVYGPITDFDWRPGA